MSKKKAFVLRIDEEILNAVEKWATDEFRSTNGQLEWMIANILKHNGRYKKESNLTKNKDDNQKE